MHTILVIDDEEPILRHFKDLLRILQHDAITASNSDDGLALAVEHEHIDCIISDLCMPGRLKEMKFIAELRKVRPDVPLIVISGFPTPDVLRSCEELGVAEFIAKPFQLSYVEELLQKLLPPVVDS